MTRLLLVRHAETAWNAQKRYLGHTNLALSERGLLQAAALAGRLAGEPFSTVYTSDLRRAAATAAALANGSPVVVDKRLRELHFGVFEGLTYDEILVRYPQEGAAWSQDPHVPPPGGEPLRDMSARVQAFLREATERTAEPAVVVSHGGPLRVLLCLALGLPVERQWQFRLDHASLTILEVFDSGAILSLLNDALHVRGIQVDNS